MPHSFVISTRKTALCLIHFSIFLRYEKLCRPRDFVSICISSVCPESFKSSLFRLTAKTRPKALLLVNGQLILNSNWRYTVSFNFLLFRIIRNCGGWVNFAKVIHNVLDECFKVVFGIVYLSRRIVQFTPKIWGKMNATWLPSENTHEQLK